MALGQQAAGGVGDVLAAVGVLAVPDELLGAALGTQADGFVGEQLVGGEAVVQLDDLDILGTEAGFLVQLGGASPDSSPRPPRADHSPIGNNSLG